MTNTTSTYRCPCWECCAAREDEQRDSRVNIPLPVEIAISASRLNALAQRLLDNYQSINNYHSNITEIQTNLAAKAKNIQSSSSKDAGMRELSSMLDHAVPEVEASVSLCERSLEMESEFADNLENLKSLKKRSRQLHILLNDSTEDLYQSFIKLSEVIKKSNLSETLHTFNEFFNNLRAITSELSTFFQDT